MTHSVDNSIFRYFEITVRLGANSSVKMSFEKLEENGRNQLKTGSDLKGTGGRHHGGVIIGGRPRSVLVI